MHVAYTWDGTTLKCYANGVRQFANTALSGDVGINGAVSHRIGRSAASAEWMNERRNISERKRWKTILNDV